MVAGPRVNVNTDEGYALALTDRGEVYSWGKGTKYRLGHTEDSNNMKTPKLIQALSGMDIKMVII